jgi:hypothetical protein
MSTNNSSKKGSSIGTAVSRSQQIIAELEHPEIEEKRKRAISKSPKIREKDLCVDELLPRTWIQFKKGSDKNESMRLFKRLYGVRPVGEKMKPLSLKK